MLQLAYTRRVLGAVRSGSVCGPLRAVKDACGGVPRWPAATIRRWHDECEISTAAMLLHPPSTATVFAVTVGQVLGGVAASVVVAEAGLVLPSASP